LLFLYIFLAPNGDGIPAAKEQLNNFKAWLNTFNSPNVSVDMRFDHSQKQVGASCGVVALEVLKLLKHDANFDNLLDNELFDFKPCVHPSLINKAMQCVYPRASKKRCSSTSEHFDNTSLNTIYSDISSLLPRGSPPVDRSPEAYVSITSFEGMLKEVTRNLDAFKMDVDKPDDQLFICFNSHPADEVTLQHVTDQPSTEHWIALTMFMHREESRG